MYLYQKIYKYKIIIQSNKK